MAITTGAKKAIRQAERKRVFNIRRTRAMKDSIKIIEKALDAGDAAAAEKELPTAYKALDKAAKMNTIKKGNASRKKSRLAAAIVRLKGGEKK